MQINLKKKPYFSLIVTIFVAGFLFLNQAKGQEQIDDSQILSQIGSDGTRIVISTSGPAKFTSHWLDEPPRLVIEFQSGNIISKIDKEVIVNQGVIKKITSSYFGKRGEKALKSLTFELKEKVPYNIWQEDSSIVVDIKSPIGISKSLVEVENKDISTGVQTSDVIIKRLEAMDTALIQVTQSRASLESPPAEIGEEIFGEIDKVDEGIIPTKTEPSPIFVPEAISIPETMPTMERRAIWGVAFWLGGLALVSGSGFLIWHRHRSNTDQKLKRLKSKLEEENKRFEQERTIRKAVEKASLKKEEEYKQLKSELQDKNNQLKKEEAICESIKKAALEKGKEYKNLEAVLQKQNKRLKEAEAIRAAKEKAMLEKEEECKELKNSYESLKDIMIEKTLAKKMLTKAGKETLWVSGKSEEKRKSPRFALTKDFNKTIVLRIQTSRQSYLRSFVNNISSGGLCFETEREFNEKEPINLRLFFYGAKVPMIKAQTRIIWRKTVGQMNFYGIAFEVMEEKDKSELDDYVESNIPKEATV